MNAINPVPKVRDGQDLIAVVITPGAESQSIATALEAAAACANVTVVLEPARVGDIPRERTLYLCSNASTLKEVTPEKAAVIMGDLGTAAAASAEYHSFTLREGLAFAAWCLANASEFALRTSAIVVQGSELGLDEARFLSLCQMLGLNGPPDELRRIASALSRDWTARYSNGARAPGDTDASDETEAIVLDRTLDIYRRGLTGPSEQGWWARTLFCDGSDGTRPCPETIDVTGRGRNLFFGPGIALGPGHWRITAHLDLCEEAARCQFRFDFGQLANMAPEYVFPKGPGRYDVSIENTWTRANAVELRLWLHRAAFHGEIRLLGATIERLADCPAEGSARSDRSVASAAS